jgi:4-amino-4-deoxy-L-arabinose transferase-like glycosyltransferase
MLLLPVMVVLSRSFGVTWDERDQQKHGELTWRYLAGSGDDALFFENGAAAGVAYGPLFDLTGIALQKALPRVDRFVVRHGLNATFGWLAVLSCGLMARRLLGAGAGILAMALLASSPRFFGDSMNNPKDVPFAALSTLALYLIGTVESGYPYLRLRHVLALTLVIGLGITTRPIALLSLGYLAIVLAARMVRQRDASVNHAVRTVAALGVIGLGALLLASIAWPWAAARPLYGPFESLLKLSRFDWSGEVLFKSTSVPAREMRWDYVPTWLLISTPFGVLTGALASLLRLRRGEAARAGILGLWAVFLFPTLLVIVRRSTLYDGIRHLLFVIPLLAVLAAAGWTALLAGPRPFFRRIAAAGLALALLEPLAFQLRNHPNQIVYFNALAGGPAGAFGRYDLDYWGNCALQAVQWSADLAGRERTPIVLSGQPENVVDYDSRRFASLVFRKLPRQEHNLEIHVLRGSASWVTTEAARPDIVYRVTTADGAPLCTVVPGPRYEALGARRSPPPAKTT